MTYERRVKKYFKEKAEKYDLVDKQLYWQLSDAILWKKLTSYLDTLQPNFKFLDAGGGTGRWTHKILTQYPKASGALIDLSEDMLRVAQKTAKSNNTAARLYAAQGNLNRSIKTLVPFPVDITFNFHNVIGFVDSPKQFIRRLTEVVKPKGYIVTLAPNLYHAVYFNVLLGNIAKAKKILSTKKGKFTKEMPDIHFLSPAQIEEYYTSAGLTILETTGFPTSIYPGFLETQIEGTTSTLATTLSKRKNLTDLIAIEMNLSAQKDIASRGNNIFIVGQK